MKAETNSLIVFDLVLEYTSNACMLTDEVRGHSNMQNHNSSTRYATLHAAENESDNRALLVPD
jgi:hypothetical protein